MSKANLNNAQYWEERSVRIIESGEKTVYEMLTDSEKLFKSAIRSIEKEIQAFYGRYSLETGVSVEEIRQRLSPSELATAKEDIARYYAEVARLGGYSPGYQAYLRSLSARVYMSRLEELKMQMQNIVENLYREQNIKFTDTFSEVYEDSYYRQMFDLQQGFGFANEFTALNTRIIDTAIQQKWLGRNYSKSLWEHKDRLLFSLENTFMRGIALGWNPRKIGRAMADDIMTQYDRSTVANAVRLARTEFNFIANQATMKAYEEHGVVNKYRFIATLDHRTSEECQELDGDVFELTEAVVGANYPPVHPNCRSTTVAYFPPDEINAMFEKAQRAARDPITGEIFYVPADMTYKEWRDSLSIEQGKAFMAKRKEVYG